MTTVTPGRTWKSVAITIAVICGVLLVVAIGGATLFFYRHVTTDLVDSDGAAREFERVRARFAGQDPLVEYRGFQQTPIVRRNASRPRRELVALHVVAYDGHDQKLRHVDIPAGLLRFMTVGGKIRLANLDMFGDDRDRITLDDLERHGPGLIVDESLGYNSVTSRLLVWTE